MKLFPHPLEIRVFLGNQRAQGGRQELIVFLQRRQNRTGRQIELRQAPAVVLHLLNEFQSRLAVRQNSCRGSRSDGGESDALLRLKAQSAQAAEKFPFDLARVRLNQDRKTL